MRLLHCHIENFGKLHDFDFDFREGLQILLRENGYGKSTFAAFLRVCFYGFSGERKQDITENERRRYMPWQGGRFGGELRFERAGRRYRLERMFGEKRSQDHFALYDLDSGLPSTDFSERIGEELFRIDAASFERTVFSGQLRVRSEMNADIHAKLGDVSETAFDMRSFESAMLRIREEQNRLSPLRKTGLIYKKRLEVEALLAELRRRENVEAEWKRISGQLSALRQQREKHRRNAAAIQTELHALSCERDRLFHALSDWQKEQQRRREISEREEAERLRREEQESGERERSRHSGRLLWALLLRGFSLLFLVMAAVLLLYASLRRASSQFLLYNTALLLLSAAGFGQLAALFLRRGWERRRKAAEEASDGGTLTGRRIVVQQPPSRSDESEEERQRGEELSAELRRFQESGEGRILELSQRLEEEMRAGEVISEQLREAGEQAEELSAELRTLSEAALRTERTEELRALEKRYALLNLTQQYLQRAKERFAKKYRKPLEEGFRYYYRLLLGTTDGSLPSEEVQSFRLDANLEIRFRQEGRERGIACLSEGYRDLLFLCRRFAVIDSMYRAEKPFLILDDPFVNLDDDKMNGAMDFLQQCAGRYQILYLTCSESRSGY
ncbi:AAA family ATPase [Oribacterium sp. oral taxon 102]|uniref:ATP-binding protein n=1 Tax=Oribacterium sp. oral taxon 102 TaxID=671214 RepID=UPI0015B95D97|nr:ATP-binding protein [Oribacterium sp. oral taxon 102]NWO22325.1 AAA family ATPase [Oribacterium sp. oral taxon 102]